MKNLGAYILICIGFFITFVLANDGIHRFEQLKSYEE